MLESVNIFYQKLKKEKIRKFMQLINPLPTFKDLQILNPALKAVFWDMDGTIMETEILHVKASLVVIKKYNPDFNESLIEIEKNMTGRTDSQFFQTYREKGLLKELNIDQFLQEKNDILFTILNEIQPQEIFSEKIRSLLIELSTNHIKLAVVTSSEKDIAFAFLEFLDIKKYFDHIITRADTELNKPNPEPYFYATKLLGHDPKEIIVFEDSQFGITAARGANLYVHHANWYQDSTHPKF